MKNRQTKCTGLSLTVFMFSVLGNVSTPSLTRILLSTWLWTQVTYILSICVLSIERNHLIANAPWLAGSVLTVLLDFVVRSSPLSLLSICNNHFVCLIGPRSVLLLPIRTSPFTGNVAHRRLTSRSTFFIIVLRMVPILHVLLDTSYYLPMLLHCHKPRCDCSV